MSIPKKEYICSVCGDKIISADGKLIFPCRGKEFCPRTGKVCQVKTFAGEGLFGPKPREVH